MVVLNGIWSGTSAQFECLETGCPEIAPRPLPIRDFGSVHLCNIRSEELEGPSNYFRSPEGAIFRLSLEGVL